MGEGSKFDFKKYLPYIVGAVVVIAIIILLATIFTSGPKKAVKKFVSGMDKQNASKVVKSIDVKGIQAWSKIGGYYGVDVEDFEDEDYEEFIGYYEEIDDEDIEDKLEDFEDNMKDSFDDMDDDYKSYKIKVEEFKSVDEIGKDLYVVKAKISTKAKPDDDDVDEIDESDIVEFVVYKNKIVSIPLF